METKAWMILAVNPGSTTTKVAVYAGEKELYKDVVAHTTADLSGFKRIQEQFVMRKEAILASLARNAFPIESIDAVVGRGGLVKPIPGGVYTVNEDMVHDLRHGISGEHASNLGGLIAYEVSRELGVPAFVVDPVVVDEMEPIAKLTGFPELSRRSIFHALNQKAVGRTAAAALGKKYEESTLIIAHLGGGISVGVHVNGRVVDVNNALDGDGPFAVERAGQLPAGELIRLCFSGRFTEAELLARVRRQGGLVGQLGLNDAREVERRIAGGDERARLVYEGIAYHTAKEIASLAAAVSGKVDAVVLTGGLAHSEMLTGWITARVQFLAQVLRFPGEEEMSALVQGALRVLNGEEPAREYH